MFLFKLFDVFRNSYWNGFSDGFSFMLFLFILKMHGHAVFCTPCYPGRFKTLLSRIKRRDITVPELETFLESFENDPFVPKNMKKKLLLCSVISRNIFLSRLRAYQWKRSPILNI